MGTTQVEALIDIKMHLSNKVLILVAVLGLAIATAVTNANPMPNTGGRSNNNQQQQNNNNQQQQNNNNNNQQQNNNNQQQQQNNNNNNNQQQQNNNNQQQQPTTTKQQTYSDGVNWFFNCKRDIWDYQNCWSNDSNHCCFPWSLSHDKTRFIMIML